ncbi:hypothetical protein DER44DRAFT_737180 [Fusarium oxysporum]|nr:hypothetical protein DER44DRAFT_737180 [Fusarium oxysporum]
MALSRLVKYFALLRKAGCSVSNLSQLAARGPAEEQSRIAVQTVKSKYSQAEWESVARPLRNILREKQRIALVAYLLANPPTNLSRTWRNANDLYAFFLIDVEMGPCQLTSRIKQAVCSVQLFVQQCQLNLEPDAGLKSQVVSSANRQVYMYPENFLDPSLRDDKTPFFKDLETELQQNNITNDVAEEAFGNYLEKLHVVSRMKILSYYHESESTSSGVPALDTLHVFAVTRGAPREIYYRQRRDGRIWGPWQRVDLDLQSDHVVPVIWNRKLHLFWLQFTEKQFKRPVSMPTAGSDVPAGNTYWEVKLAWSKLKGGKWLAKKVSADSLAVQKTGSSALDVLNEVDPPPALKLAGSGRNAMSCKSEITPDGKLRINILCDLIKPGLLGYFEFDGINGSPTVTDKQFKWTQNPTWVSAVTDLVGYITMPDIAAKITLQQVNALRKTPGGIYSLVWAPQDQQFITQRPFFFQHDQRAFFVEPEDTFYNITRPFPITGLWDGNALNPAWLDGRLLAGYVDRLNPTTPIAQGPVLPNAGEAGAVQNIRTFPLSEQFKSVASTLATPVVSNTRLTATATDYNWELFYHIPMLVADRLMSNQRFAEAQTWLRYIFDPTDTSPLPKPARYWKTKPFVQMQSGDYAEQMIASIFTALAARGNPTEWRDQPFNPYFVARMRIMAFQMATVMKYLDNLIAWGDQLFGRDTIESINEATQLYILAANILGPRPSEIPTRTIPVVQTYNSLDGKLDDFSNALVQIEELAPNYSSIASRLIRIRPGRLRQGATPTMLYFCAPRNQKLMAYWDTVSDRLFKVRHCMNLHGIVRELALWDPPIDPMLLIRAKAAGVDISTVLSDVAAVVPFHRYTTYAAKAMELTNEVKAFGAALLQALEKQDAEAFSLLNSDNEISLLKAVRDVKTQQADEADKQVGALIAGKAVVSERFDHYSNLSFMNAWEWTHMGLEAASLVIQTIEAATQPVSAGANLMPDVKIGAPTTVGATFGGNNLGKSSSKFSTFLFRSAGLLSKAASMTSTMAGYYRRSEDWDLQKAVASKEVAQFDFQIAAADIRKAIADREVENHDLQVTNAQAANDYMRTKFTNQQLYSWTIKEVAALYFRAYSLAYETAKRAERAFCHERGLGMTNYIQFGYWDSMQKGLLAGERLMMDLKRLDAAYLDTDAREYELTKSVSLAQLNPVALLQFRDGGGCFFDIPEAIFDLDCPGHYMRRIKSVSVTIPCLTGPYTSVAVRLALIKSSIRTSNLLTAGRGQYGRTGDGDGRFQDLYGHLQAIVTSSAANDSGTFDTAAGSARDDRYLPFERYGAISSWQLAVPSAVPGRGPPGAAGTGGFKQFDPNSVTDVVLQIQYTAREGGDALRDQAATELRQKALQAIVLAEGQNGLAKLVDLQREFADEWYRFAHPPTTASGGQRMVVALTRDRLPYMMATARDVVVDTVEIFLQVAPAFVGSHTADTLKLYLRRDTGSTAPPTDQDLLVLSSWKGTTIKATSKVLDKPLVGKWLLEGGLDDLETRIDSEAISQAFLVLHYSVTW